MKLLVSRGKNALSVMLNKARSRRAVLVGLAATGAMIVLHREPAAAADGKKTFTIPQNSDRYRAQSGPAPGRTQGPLG